MNDYDKTWQIVESMARTKLLMNDHKGRIEKVNPGRLLSLAAKEIEELRGAIAMNRYMDVIEEAADVMNFVTAAAHQVIHTYRNKDGYTRQNEITNHETMDHSAYIGTPIRSGPQLGSGNNSVRDSGADEPTSSNHNKRDPARVISRSGRSEDGGYPNSN